METTVHINAQIVWAVKRTPAGVFIGVCDPLGLTLEADDQAEMNSLIAESHHVLFADLLADGELETFLKARGWTVNNLPQATDAGVRFEVPFTIEPRSQHAS